jgi:YhcH/YjgK/YiaL family protein
MVVNGVEQIGICNKSECRSIEAFNAEKDLEKLEGKIDLITLRTGYFAVFFPQDGHVPGLKMGNKENRVKKVVFKVPV